MLVKVDVLFKYIEQCSPSTDDSGNTIYKKYKVVFDAPNGDGKLKEEEVTFLADNKDLAQKLLDKEASKNSVTYIPADFTIDIKKGRYGMYFELVNVTFND